MPNTPVALTIAGSDSGGGAGIQADLKTFTAFRVFGTSVMTCLTAQNPQAVTGILEVTPELLLQQIEAVFSYFPVGAFKTGMLFSSTIIQTLGQYLANHPHPPLVVDPVMVATSGATLLQPEAIASLQRLILPHAALITPNVAESEILAARKITHYSELQEAAHLIYARYGAPVIVKGGHLPQHEEAVDYFYDGVEGLEFRSRFVPGVNAHGTGCTFSAAITAGLAQGNGLRESIGQAKSYLESSLLQALQIGEDALLCHWPQIN